jgi:hypothetical protein
MRTGRHYIPCYVKLSIMTAQDQQAKAETVVIHDNGAYTTYRV